jgi:hypothetical protein
MILARFVAWLNSRLNHWKRVRKARGEKAQEEVDQLKARRVAAQKTNSSMRHIG